ncbi:antibiotic biosynthesis monooxygenase family protein [Breoghania sp.]|uniref:putative quinol monooxygenase n=1 Tax=Breoghania sp. TaxID=2065378 RepID=UPI0029CA9E17|nr:antibiotic biosynthesis monooxygenase family protein [Breoghania sp.]
MSNLFSIVEITIKPQQRGAYLDPLRELLRKGATSGAFLSQKIHINPRKPSTVVVTLRWTSEEAMRAFQNSDLIHDFLNETAGCLAGPSIYKTFTIESEQTLL